MTTNKTKFRLIGRTNVFICRAQWRNKLGTWCVLGITPDNRLQTVARLVDVIAIR